MFVIKEKNSNNYFCGFSEDTAIIKNNESSADRFANESNAKTQIKQLSYLNLELEVKKV